LANLSVEAHQDSKGYKFGLAGSDNIKADAKAQGGILGRERGGAAGGCEIDGVVAVAAAWAGGLAVSV
jgi:hypothetical protein